MNTFSIKRVFAFSWDIFKKHAWLLIGISVCIWVLSFGFQLIGGALGEEMSVLAGIIVFVIGWIITTMMNMGYLYITLQLARKKEASIEDLLTPSQFFFQYIVASFIYSLIVFVGLLLFIVPGVIWAIRYGFFQYLIVDSCQDPFRALYISAKITKGHTWQLFLLGLALIAFNLLGLLAFVVGLLVTVPVSILIGARVYDRLLMKNKLKFSD